MRCKFVLLQRDIGYENIKILLLSRMKRTAAVLPTIEPPIPSSQRVKAMTPPLAPIVQHRTYTKQLGNIVQ